MYDAVIVGSGFSGLISAIHLIRKNITNFIILEREEIAGGTWQNNQYPGARVDVLSKLYSISFEPYDWSELYPDQQEILDYTNYVIDKHNLRDRIKTSNNVSSMVLDESTNTWTINTHGGDTYTTKVLINATGYLSQVNIPEIPGAETFAGKSMHTAQWDHSYDLEGKRVAVIGTGASAIQVIPSIADKVDKLHVMQRSANWVIPRKNKKLSNFHRKLQKFSLIRKLNRSFVYVYNEIRVIGFEYVPLLMRSTVRLGSLMHLYKQVSDKELRKKLTPTYTIGCRRILISDDYYPALQKDNVFLQATGVKEINRDGIVTSDDKLIELDAIVYATGFHAYANDKCLPFDIIGRNGKNMSAAWNNFPQAYVGSSVPDFPNFFFVSGPHTATAHTSAIFISESQMGYIIGAASRIIQDDNCNSIEVKKEVCDKYNQDIQDATKSSVWEKGNCTSWYKNEDGLNTAIYPGFTFIFRRRANRFIASEHIIT